MTNVSQDDVKHVAKLANLHLTEEEIKKYTPQLSKIIDYISELSEVDTKNIEPTSQTTGLANVTSDDTVNQENILTQDEALSGTEETHNGYFKVGAILSERSDK